jgi:hypothetical protein
MESMQNEHWLEIEMSNIISLFTLGHYVFFLAFGITLKIYPAIIINYN